MIEIFLGADGRLELQPINDICLRTLRLLFWQQVLEDILELSVNCLDVVVFELRRLNHLHHFGIEQVVLALQRPYLRLQSGYLFNEGLFFCLI